MRLCRSGWDALAILFIVSPALTLCAERAASAPKSESRIAAALENITNLNRPGLDGYATFWEGNKSFNADARRSAP